MATGQRARKLTNKISRRLSVIRASRFLWLVAVVAMPTLVLAVENDKGYTATLVISSSGKPLLAITNTSESAITALAATVDLSNGLKRAECRIYYDSIIDSFNDPVIMPGNTARIP